MTRLRILKRMMATMLLTAVWGVVQAQQLKATLSHYTTNDGLASNAIADLKQDDYGFIWIATWNGLSRFDGYNFYNYPTGAISHIPNLHNRIYDLTVDHQQNIWMRMYDYRVFVLMRKTDRIVNPFEGISGNEEFRAQSPIVVTSNGDVMVPIDGIGIYKVSMGQNGLHSQLITTVGLKVNAMVEGYQNDVWLATDEGVHRMDSRNLTVERDGLFTDEKVSCLYSNGYNIFAGTKSGKIFSFSYGQEPRLVRDGGNAVTSLFVDSHDIVWFADNKMGAMRIMPGSNVEKRFTHNVRARDYDSNSASFTEHGGLVWVRMNQGGFGYYNRETDEIEYFHNDPSNPWNLSNKIQASLVLEEGVVWESTSRRGIDKLEIMNKMIERRKLVENTDAEFDNEIRAICYDTKNKLLLMANKSGVLFLIREDGSRTTLTNAANGEPLGRVYGISKDSRGNFWLSSKDNGLFKMTPNTAGGYSIVNFCHNDDDNYSLSDNRAYTAVEDKQGNIWIATYGGGVNLLKKDSTRFISYLNEMKNYPRNSHKKVRTLALDRDGKVWAGTTDGILIMSYQKGLLNINRLEESKEYPDSILMSNDVVCLERDQNGMMWVGTNGGGLAHTTGQDSDGCWIFEHFGYKNGLPSEEIRSITTDQRGNVWFSTENELCSYDTQKNSFSTFTELEGVDETICSEGAALALPNNVILFGTVDGYYIVDCDKLAGQTKASRLKLHLTDFWVNGELQSPHLNNFLPYYVPEATEVELPKGTKEFSIRFASLNYQLQHRVHYQYMLEGYDKTWNNAGKDRMGTYSNLSSGTYTLKVRAYLMETGEKHNEIKLTIIIHGRPFYAHWWFWFIILLLIGVAAGGGYWWLKHRSSSPAKKKADDSVSDQADQPVEEEEIIEAEQIDVF